MGNLNGGSGAIVVIPGQGGGKPGGSSPAAGATIPTLASIINGSERAILNSFIAEYLAKNPVSAVVDPAALASAIAAYMAQNPIPSGPSDSHIEGVIGDYLTQTGQDWTNDDITREIQALLTDDDFTDAVKDTFIVAGVFTATIAAAATAPTTMVVADVQQWVQVNINGVAGLLPIFKIPTP